MKGNLLEFHISPRPAKEGQPIKITFKYRVDKTTITVGIVNAGETMTRYISIPVNGNKGEATFVIPRGWGRMLYMSHKDFYVGTVTVNK